MKKIFKKVLCFVLCGILMVAGIPIVAAEPQEEPIKILAIGNSYSCNSTQFISRIAETLGKKVTVTVLYYGGCTLEQHVKFYNKNSAVYQFYTDGVMDWVNYRTMKDAFNADDYDYVTLHQGTSTAAVFDTYWTEEKPWLTDLYSIIQEHEPQAKVMINQTWSFCETCVTEPKDIWPEPYEYSVDMFKDVEASYEMAADMLGLNKETDIIPVGKAVQLAKDEYGFGDFHNNDSNSGFTDAQLCENGCLYTDNIHHLNVRGRYIAACVWLEKIFGLDCREATFYPEGVLTAEECVILRNIAHETVTGEKAYIEGDWRVLPEGDGVEIVHYMGSVDEVGSVKIPTTIGGKKVIRVDDSAFKYIEGLKKIILPGDDTIEYEDGAFRDYVVIDNLWDGTSVKPTQGLGTESDPYKITNGSELYWAVTNKNTGVYFKLTNDIILGDIVVDTENGVAYVSKDTHEWYLGGTNENATFEGIIDGDNHTIKGLYIDHDFEQPEDKWVDAPGALIGRGGNGMAVKNLAIENSYIKVLNGTAAAFVGTTGTSASVDLSFNGCYLGENVYIYGGRAGGFIGSGNGTGYVSGITNCYSLATIEGVGFVGALTGGVWSCQSNPVTNCYATMQLYGQIPMKYVDCYAPAQKYNWGKETIISVEEMKSSDAVVKMAGLNEAYTLPIGGFPVLKKFVGKDENVWSGFAAAHLQGEGTEESPYLITNGEEFSRMILNGGKEGSYFRLENDIYLNEIDGVDWSTGKPVGDYIACPWFNNIEYRGYFDGNGHVVYGIYYPIDNGRDYAQNSVYAALFPTIGQNTHVKNLGVRYSYIEVKGVASAIVGRAANNTKSVNIRIDSCFSDETVTVKYSDNGTQSGMGSGGIFGGGSSVPDVIVSNCYSFANAKYKIVASTWTVPESFVVENCFGDGALWSSTSNGNHIKTARNCYSTAAPNATFKFWEQLSAEDMQGLDVFERMTLGDKFVATEGYPVLEVFLKEEILIGDVDGNGLINTGDLATLKLFLAGVNGNICDGADMNEDAKVDTTDLASLKLYLASN